MKLVDQSWTFVSEPNGDDMVRRIEEAGRTCYKSEDRITSESSKKFVAHAIKIGHHSIIEHENVSIRIICDRGVSHEIVRHRLAAYSQESTRYCNYGKGKFGGEITCVTPTFELTYSDKVILRLIEQHYLRRLGEGLTPQDARYFLPNGLKTEIVMTCNVREWRHVFALRTSPKAHPQIRMLMQDIMEGFQLIMPVLFDNIGE
jgi:thymidylate synthase (FAD)